MTGTSFCVTYQNQIWAPARRSGRASSRPLGAGRVQGAGGGPTHPGCVVLAQPLCSLLLSQLEVHPKQAEKLPTDIARLVIAVASTRRPTRGRPEGRVHYRSCIGNCRAARCASTRLACRALLTPNSRNAPCARVALPLPLGSGMPRRMCGSHAAARTRVQHTSIYTTRPRRPAGA